MNTAGSGFPRLSLLFSSALAVRRRNWIIRTGSHTRGTGYFQSGGLSEWPSLISQWGMTWCMGWWSVPLCGESRVWPLWNVMSQGKHATGNTQKGRHWKRRQAQRCRFIFWIDGTVNTSSVWERFCKPKRNVFATTTFSVYQMPIHQSMHNVK